MQHVLDTLASLAPEEITISNLKTTLESLDLWSVSYESFLVDPEARGSYGRKVLLHHPLECVMVHWPPGARSAVHHHNGFWGFVAVLEGSCEETSYQFEAGQLLEAETTTCSAGDLLEEAEDAIHLLRNLSDTERAVTLHFYYPPVDSLDGTRIFDVEQQRIGVLNARAQSGSWAEPKDHFKRIEENAFEFVPFN